MKCPIIERLSGFRVEKGIQMKKEFTKKGNSIDFTRQSKRLPSFRIEKGMIIIYKNN
jgi:hypothetical protein